MWINGQGLAFRCRLLLGSSSWAIHGRNLLVDDRGYGLVGTADARSFVLRPLTPFPGWPAVAYNSSPTDLDLLARTGAFAALSEPYEIAVAPETLARHLDALRAASCTILSTRDYLARRLAGAALPSRAVLLHFDDGYLDNWLAAAPILRALWGGR